MVRNFQNLALATEVEPEGPESERVFLETLEENFEAPHFLDRLNETDKQALSVNGTCLAFKRGEILFRRGSPHAGIYIIQKGRIRTFFVSSAGHEITLAYWSQNHFVGGPEIFGRGTHVWSGMAMCHTEVLFVRGSQLMKLIQEYPKIALAIIEGLVLKGRRFSSLVQMLGTQDAPARLAHVILNLCEIHGRTIKNETRVVPAFTHDELASMIGVTRQWVSITLSKFRAEGILRMDGRSIVVTNRSKLQSYLNS